MAGDEPRAGWMWLVLATAVFAIPTGAGCIGHRGAFGLLLKLSKERAAAFMAELFRHRSRAAHGEMPI
jgi:hypothetical protein